MGKFILEDLTGEMECIVFPGAFEDCEEAIQEDSVVVLEGQAMVEVEDENVDIQINVQKITPVISAKRVYMRLNNIFDWKGSVEALVAQHTGSDPLFIYFEDEKQVFESKMRVRGSLELEKEFTDRFGKDNYVVLGS